MRDGLLEGSKRLESAVDDGLTLSPFLSKAAWPQHFLPLQSDSFKSVFPVSPGVYTDSDEMVFSEDSAPSFSGALPVFGRQEGLGEV